MLEKVPLDIFAKMTAVMSLQGMFKLLDITSVISWKVEFSALKVIH